MADKRMKLWNDSVTSSSQSSRNEEVHFPSFGNETATPTTSENNYVGAAVVNTHIPSMMPPFPLNVPDTSSPELTNVSLISQNPAMDNGHNIGASASKLCGGPFSASQVESKINEFRQCLTLDDVTPSGRLAGDSNFSRPQLDWNSFSHGSERYPSSTLWDTGEVRNYGNDMANQDQFGGCDKIDGNFLTLGIGSNSEPISDSRGAERVFFPLFPTPNVQNSGSSLYPGWTPAQSFPELQRSVAVSSPAQNRGAFSRLTQNASIFSSPSQNLGSWPTLNYSFGVSGVGGSMDSGFASLNHSTGFQGFPGQQFPAYQGGIAQSGEEKMFSKDSGPQWAGDSNLPTKWGGIAQVAERGPFPENMSIPVQPNGNVGQSRSRSLTVPPGSSRLLMPSRQSSRTPIPKGHQEVSHKRPANRPPASARASQRRIRSTAPSIPSVSKVSENAGSPQPTVLPKVCTAAVQTVPKTTIRLPKPARSARPFVSMAKETAVRKMQDRDRSLKPGGWNCYLCKRDLLFTPTGPITQPRAPPASAILPCGHYFHDECLQNITPEDQAGNPPCIPCAIGNN